MVTQSQRPFLLIGMLALVVVVMMSFYIELLGWRITEAEITFSQAWSHSFISRALLTSTGASLLGLAALAVGMLLPFTRERTKRYLIFIWVAGAAVFLLAMLGLVMWAPEL